MKRMLLILLLFTLALVTSCDRVLRVDIVLPVELLPYFEWLLKFPGWNRAPLAPTPTGIWTEFSENMFQKGPPPWEFLPASTRLINFIVKYPHN